MSSALERLDIVPDEREPVALLSGAATDRVRVARLLRRVLGAVTLAPDVESLRDATGPRILALHGDASGPEERCALLRGAVHGSRLPVVVLTTKGLMRQELACLFGDRTLTNLVVVPGSGVDAGDLLTTVRKLASGDIFGIEQYFRLGVQVESFRVHSSTERAEVLGRVDRFAADRGLTSRVRGLARILADEFLTNALYNAPVGPDGMRHYAACPRTVSVELPLGRSVEMRLCSDGERLGLSAADPFGSLSADRVQEYLARGFRCGEDQVAETSGGAGLGLYRALDSVSHLVVNVDPGRVTEMIGLIDIRGTYRDFASAGKSLNIFVVERTP